MDFPHSLVGRVHNAMTSLFAQGKLVRICRGKYRLPRFGETPAIAWAESASIVDRPRTWQVGLKPQEKNDL
jgi:hypothetical protein